MTSRAVADYSKQQNMYLTNSGLHCSFGVNFDSIYPRNSWKERQRQQQQQQWLH